MFTVKHIDKSGNEALLACASFVKERRSDGFTQYLALPDGPDSRANYIATWCGDDKRSHLDYHAIYVMNADGATVSTHYFDDPQHDASGPSVSS